MLLDWNGDYFFLLSYSLVQGEIVSLMKFTTSKECLLRQIIVFASQGFRKKKLGK